MESQLPNLYVWFTKLNLTCFIPWQFDTDENRYDFADERFAIEGPSDRKVVAFGHRQDMDTFAAFEIINGVVSEKVIVFHPSFQNNIHNWNIIESEYQNFFTFMQELVLPDMQAWIEDEDLNDYL
jgi:hypothetical protein